jgi:hypothetical protein
MSIEAMKQALEALENHTAIKHPQQMHYWESAVDALRQAIEQAEMIEKGTKAWANTPDNWVDDLRGGAEPVAFRNINTGDFCTGGYLRKDWAKWQPLYAAPVHASENAEKQEPVAWIKEQELAYMSAAAGIGEVQWKTNLGLRPEPGDVPLYTKPLPPIYTTPIPPPECQTEEEKRAFAFGWWKAMEKKKQWVGLTDGEIYDIREDFTYNDEDFNEVGFAKAIEAKLKEVNHG